MGRRIAACILLLYTLVVSCNSMPTTTRGSSSTITGSGASEVPISDIPTGIVTSESVVTTIQGPIETEYNVLNGWGIVPPITAISGSSIIVGYPTPLAGTNQTVVKAPDLVTLRDKTSTFAAYLVLATNSAGSTMTKALTPSWTSTVTAIPTGLYTTKVSNAAWSTNTRLTTTLGAESVPTVLPVLVGCKACGGENSGLVIGNLSIYPNTMYALSQLPDWPTFYWPCIFNCGNGTLEPLEINPPFTGSDPNPNADKSSTSTSISLPWPSYSTNTTDPAYIIFPKQNATSAQEASFMKKLAKEISHPDTISADYGKLDNFTGNVTFVTANLTPAEVTKLNITTGDSPIDGIYEDVVADIWG